MNFWNCLDPMKQIPMLYQKRKSKKKESKKERKKVQEQTTVNIHIDTDVTVMNSEN